MGSKAKIAKFILPIITNNMTNKRVYIEPFCGGCNSIMHVRGVRIANDKNKYLIAMWKSLCDGVKYPTIINRDMYADVRNSYNKKDGRYSDDFIGWIGWMGSFNGRFFDGGYSGHNVNGRDYITEQIKNTLGQVEQLKGVKWESSNYSDIYYPDRSLIYCDIPYRNTKQYSTSKDFNYEDFYNWCKNMKDKGHTIFISEYWMPEDFICVWKKEVTNSMNQKNTKKTVEKLFTI